MSQGQLVYVMGASGVGKDTLLNYARNELKNDYRVVFAHRYITRPVESKGENHIALSNEEFLNRLDSGLFSLAWQAHSLWYGIGVEINHWLQANKTVVINGSRAYLEIASQKFPDLLPILIEADQDTLAQRLKDRNRESEAEVQQRLSRAVLPTLSTNGATVSISNNSTIANAGNQLCSHLVDSFDREAQ